MKSHISRRRFLHSGAAGLVGAGVAWPAMVGTAQAAAGVPEFCVTVCNHWSYIGIGWQLGIESSVLSVNDAMEMADREPHVKTCINLDARAYELMAEKFPEVTTRLAEYLAAGKVELIGGTYGQPMGTTIGGESNIRQIVVGRETIRKALGYELVTFLEEEEFTHPQIPQMAMLAGFRYASLAQLDTWGRAGCPRQDLNAFLWRGLDGSTIPCVPKNALFGYSPDVKQLAGSAEFKKLKSLGTPLIFCWEEFGWESPETPAYLTSPAKYLPAAARGNVEFVTLREYLDKYGARSRETIFLPMDAWNKSLTWGLGGDQIRVMDRKTEGLLLAAELFDAAASALGARSQVDLLEKAWKDLMASQSHDVGLCESSRWQGDIMAPAERIEDKHNFTWGAIGYNHLDAAEKQGRQVLDAVTADLSRRVASVTDAAGAMAVTVFNPLDRPRTDVAATGRVYPLPAHARGVVVKSRDGRVVPSQVVRSTKDAQGNLVVAELAFLATQVPSAGYDTYYLDFQPQAVPAVSAGLRVDEAGLTLENEHVRVRLDPQTGGVAGLLHKASGREMLDARRGAFPRLTGRPNPNLSLKRNPPAFYDTASSKASIDWLAKGPVRAEVRAQHSLPYLKFETRVSLAAASPYVEVYSRMLTLVPPHSDDAAADIRAGYWFSLATAFQPKEILRDYPFGVESTRNPTFHGLTFVDLQGNDAGLLLLHPGTQFFRREEAGGVSNLVMREWESHFTREYGWPIYAEYRHALWPHNPAAAAPGREPQGHDGRIHNNADRLRAAAAFTRPLLTHVAPPQRGDLPRAKSFLEVSPDGVMVTAMRRKLNGKVELRALEVEGRAAQAQLTLHLPCSRAIETDLLGTPRGDALLTSGRLNRPIAPWKIHTWEII